MSDEINYLDESMTTEEAIRNRMLNNISNEWDKEEGGYIYDSIAPVAIEMVFIGMMVRKVLNLGFAQTTNGTYLDYRAGEHGIYRKEAVFATGNIKITGKVGAKINAGLKIATEADTTLNIQSVEFITTKDVIIPEDGYIYAPIESTVAGNIGNVTANKIIVLVENNNNITSVINTEPTTGGTDTESDVDLLERYLDYVRTPGTSGNVQDYKQWALSVPGVVAVHVIPLWNGNGTVKVVILGGDNKPATEELVKTVTEYISGYDNNGYRRSPIGSLVTIVSAIPVTINIKANIVIDKDVTTLEKVKTLFESNMEEYIKENAFNSNTIYISKIGGILINTNGVLDYSDLQVNDDSINIPITTEQVAVIGEVELSEK